MRQSIGGACSIATGMFDYQSGSMFGIVFQSPRGLKQYTPGVILRRVLTVDHHDVTMLDVYYNLIKTHG